MIRIAKLTDYAVVIMARLAHEDAGFVSAAHLAKTTGLAEPTVAKILKTLAREELVESRRGINGGYGLEKSPEDITMGDIIAALEGPVRITSCVSGMTGECCIEDKCAIRGNWNRVNDAITAALDSVTLAEMAGCAGTSEGFERLAELAGQGR